MTLTFQKRYTHLLERHLLDPDEEVLEEAYQLGKEMLSTGLGIGDVGELHARALAELAAKYPDNPIGQERSHLPLLEVLMPCELLLRARGEWLTEQQAALQESEARYRAIVENSPAGICIVDEAYRFVYVNDELCRFLGRPRDELLGQDFRRFLDDQSRTLVAGRYARRQAGEAIPGRYEFNIVRPDGQRRRLEMMATVVCDIGGRPETIAQMLDITERKQAEAKIRRRSEETAALLDISEALNQLDLEAILHAVGERAKALFAADGCRIFLLEPDGETLRCVLALHDRAEAVLGLPIKMGQGVTGAVAADGEPTIVNDMLGDPRSMQVPGTPVEQEAMMFVPLLAREQILGVLSVSRLGDERPFQPADLELFKALAAMATSAIANARLFEAERTARQQTEVLREAAHVVGASLELEETLHRILAQFKRLVAYDTSERHDPQLCPGRRLRRHATSCEIRRRVAAG